MLSRKQISGHTCFRVVFSDESVSAEELRRSSRVSLIFRGRYCEAAPASSALDAANHVEFEAALPGPVVLNEVRVRALGDGSARHVPAFTVWGASPRNGAAMGSPAETYDAVDADGSRCLLQGGPWRRLVEQSSYSGEHLEVRGFALCNVPRLPRCGAGLRTALLAMPRLDAAWAAAAADGCAPLCAPLARFLLEERSKLRSYLSSGHQLKAWPGKGAVQQLVVLWMCLQLIFEHEYTEPELYAHISELCAMPPDHGVLRKEMIRHRLLEPPVIRENADRTTTTTYRLSRAGLAAAVQSDALAALAKPTEAGGGQHRPDS